MALLLVLWLLITPPQFDQDVLTASWNGPDLVIALAAPGCLSLVGPGIFSAPLACDVTTYTMSNAYTAPLSPIGRSIQLRRPNGNILTIRTPIPPGSWCLPLVDR